MVGNVDIKEGIPGKLVPLLQFQGLCLMLAAFTSHCGEWAEHKSVGAAKCRAVPRST